MGCFFDIGMGLLKKHSFWSAFLIVLINKRFMAYISEYLARDW
jgi:hypothetical protein